MYSQWNKTYKCYFCNFSWELKKWLTAFETIFSFGIAFPTVSYLSPKPGNNLIGRHHGIRWISQKNLPAQCLDHVRGCIHCMHYHGEEFLSCWTALAAFGAQQLKSFVNVASRRVPWLFFCFLRIYNGLCNSGSLNTQD